MSGTVTATDLQSVTFTISGSDLAITEDGVLTFVSPADYEFIDDPTTLHMMKHMSSLYINCHHQAQMLQLRDYS